MASIKLWEHFKNPLANFGNNYRVGRTHFDGGPQDTLEFNAQSIPQFTEIFLLKILPSSSAHSNRFTNLTKLCHPNIISHFNVWPNVLLDPNHPLVEEDDNQLEPNRLRPHLVIQLELFSQLNLETFLSSRNASPDPCQIAQYYEESQQIFCQCLDAFVYLELAGIVHGNLKVEDILVQPGESRIQIKVSGFGKIIEEEDFDDDHSFNSGPLEDYSAGSHAGDLYALAVVLISLLVNREEGQSLGEAVGKIMLNLVNNKGTLILDGYPTESDWILEMTRPEMFLRPKFTMMKYLVSQVPGYNKSFDGEALKRKITGVEALLKFSRIVEFEDHDDLEKLKFRIGVQQEPNQSEEEEQEEPQPGPSSKITKVAEQPQQPEEQEDPDVIQEQLRQLQEIKESGDFQNLDLLDPYRIEVESSMISLKCQHFSPNPTNPIELQGQDQLETGLQQIRQIIISQTTILSLAPHTDLQTFKNLVTETKLLVRLGRIQEAEAKWHQLEQIFSTRDDNEIDAECLIEYEKSIRDFQAFLLKIRYSQTGQSHRWITLSGFHVKSIQENMKRHLCTTLHEGVPIFNTNDRSLAENLARLAALEGVDSPCYKSVLQQLANANQDKLRQIKKENPLPEVKSPIILPLHWQRSKLSVLQTDFNLDQVLGEGSYGKVYKGIKLTHTGDKFDVIQFDEEGVPQFIKAFAIKIIPWGEIAEASFSLQLVHPNIASSFNVWSDDYNPDPNFQYESGSLASTTQSSASYCSSDNSAVHPNMDNPNYFKSSRNLIIQQELCTGQTLEELLQGRNSNPDSQTKMEYDKEARSIFVQLLEALVYLEIKDVAHGDLKPDNVILQLQGGIIVPKILDFGKANFTIPFATDESDEKLGHSVENRRRYTSPEQGKVENSVNLGTLGASHKSNVYSLGLILIPMLIQFKYKIHPKTKTLMSVDLNACIEDVRQVEESRKFPPELEESYPTEFGWIQAMVDHDYRRRPAASEVKQMVRLAPLYQISTSKPQPANSHRIKNMDSLFNKVIQDVASTCKYEKVNLDKETARPMTRQGAIEKCIGNDLGRHLIQFLHIKLANLRADDDSIVQSFRQAYQMGLCPLQDLKYLLHLFLDKIQDELTPEHELTKEFTTILEEISKTPPTSATDMKQFIGNMFKTGVSMQDIIARLEPNPGPETIQEIMSMWACSGMGKTLADESHHETPAEIEAALANLDLLSESSQQSGEAQGIFTNVMNLMTRAQMLNKLGRTEEVDGIMKQVFQNMAVDRTDQESQWTRLEETLGKFLKSFDMRDLLPLVAEIKETEELLRNEIGTANVQNEATKFWNELDCRCAKCQKRNETKEDQVFNQALKWSTTLTKKELPFETSKKVDDIDELD